jgi:hypothetical protein
VRPGLLIGHAEEPRQAPIVVLLSPPSPSSNTARLHLCLTAIGIVFASFNAMFHHHSRPTMLRWNCVSRMPLLCVQDAPLHLEAMVFPPANVTSWMRKRPSSYPIRVRVFALCVSALAVECCSTARRLVAVRRKHEAPRSVETLSHYNARCGLLLVTVKSPSH